MSISTNGATALLGLAFAKPKAACSPLRANHPVECVERATGVFPVTRVAPVEAVDAVLVVVLPVVLLLARVSLALFVPLTTMFSAINAAPLTTLLAHWLPKAARTPGFNHCRSNRYAVFAAGVAPVLK
jgi:hypothetical protein